MRGMRTDAGISGAAALSDRPGLMDAIAALRRGDMLLVAKLDRLSRAGELETAVLEEIVHRRGARIISVAGEGTDDDTESGELMRGIIKLFSRYERSLAAARTRAALQAKKARGERIGTEPYGQTDTERQVLAVISDCQDAGFSLPEIARELNTKGLLTRRGTPWRWEYIRGILRTRAGIPRRRNTTRRYRAVSDALAQL